MAKLRNLLKQKFCKHNYKPWANIHGDWINTFNGDRTVFLCTKCSKRKYSKDYVEAPLNYGNLINYINLKSIGDDEFAEDFKHHIIKNDQLYIEIFGGGKK